MLVIFRQFGWFPTGWRALFSVGLGLAAWAGGLCAQEPAAESGGVGMFHEFTDKQGRQLKARVVSVTNDRRSMVIADESGSTFPLEITKLSLDDQQYLKKWIATQPSLSNFRLQVEVEKVSSKTADRLKTGEYRLVNEYPAYRIKITNLSRETLENAEIEYFILRRERLRIYRDEETNQMSFSSNYDEEAGPVIITEVKPLEPLEFNRELEVVTNPITVDLVYHEGAQPLAEDILVGMIAQVRDDFGNLLGEYRSADPGIKSIEWDSLKGGESADAGTPGSATASASPASMPKATPKPRELEAWPEESFAHGDFIEPRSIPSIVGKPVQISALVELDGPDASGTILALGGKNKGFCLCVEEGELQFWIRRQAPGGERNSSRIRMPVSDIPAGEFQVVAGYDAEVMNLQINGEPKIEGPSGGILLSMPFEGLSVGFDSGGQSVGPVPPPHEFSGAIRELQVTIGD